MQTSLIDARVSCPRHTAHTPSFRPVSRRSQHIVRCQQTQPAGQLESSKSPAHNCLRLCVGSIAVQQIACAEAAQASEAVSGISEAAGTIPLALGGGAAIAALSVALIATDPQKRCAPLACQLY